MKNYYTGQQLNKSTQFEYNFNKGKDSFKLFVKHFPSKTVVEEGRNKYGKLTKYYTIYIDDQKQHTSHFNRLGSHYDAYAKLVNMTIEKMLDEKLISSIDEADPFTDEGYYKIYNYLYNNFEFFKSTLHEIGPIIKKTYELGEIAELESEIILKKIFGPDIELINTSGTAVKSDTLGGRDRIMYKNGKRYNVQIKQARDVKEVGQDYEINYTGAKLYQYIDIMVFKKGPWFYVFRTKDASNNPVMSILGNKEGYIIPKMYCIKTVKSES